ncbi:MAG TPA: TonB-dependent receptor [Bacteroidales bacterium]|nr:TonB-dependent receptor [Bacteroidales bacterium]
MEKKPSKSIFCRKCLKKLFLLSGIAMLLLWQSTAPLMAESSLQQTKVTGHVLDVKGDPMIGVNVLEKGTTNGVLTDADGAFALTVASSNSIIVFSFIGYESQEVVVGNQTSLNITLKEATTGLNEVVVIGYGTAKKKDVTGSVASINGATMRDVPAANITQALQGRISGVDMSQTNTKPGATMQIRIRGVRSLNASNDPLIVIDGIPFSGNISDISPSSIKSIDILKDASSTAIYGSRGSNGVIMITTNKGYVGQKAQVTYNGYAGLKSLFARYPMMSGPEFVKLRAYANNNGIAGSKTYANTLDESDDVNTDWQKLLYKTGFVTNHDLGLTGGTQQGSYSFGIGYYREEAIVPLQDFTRYMIRSSLDQQIGKRIRIGFTTNTNYSVSNGNNLGAVYTALDHSPIANIYNTDGTLKARYQQQTSGQQWVSTRKTLEALGDKYIDQTRTLGTYNSLYGELQIPGIEGLKYRLNLGLDYRQANGGNYTGVGVFSGTPSNNSVASINDAITTHWTAENLLTYDRNFAEKHHVNVVGMYSAERTLYNYSQVSVKDLPSDAFQFYNLGQATGDKTINPNYQNYQVSGLLSYMGRVMYSYDGRYMISAALRSDGSSRLAPGHKWHTYPAVSAGWNISEESFMKGISQIDQLKLRVGYGETSNQAVDPYKTLGLLNTRPYNFGSSYSQGLYVSELPNPVMGWEYSETYNIGVDFSLFKSRLTGTIEYYQMYTHDVLLQLSLPATSGVSSYWANIGKTENKGVELTLSGTILDNYNGWTWEAGINIYANRNKLVELASGSKKDEGNYWFVDHPIDCIYDFKKIGIWQEGEQYLTDYEPGGNAGMIKVKYTGTYDTNGKPTRAIADADKQILSMEPDFLGGFNTRVGYKGIDLSIVGTFKKGGLVNSTIYGANGYLNNLNTRSGNNVKVDYWTPDNTGAKYPRPNGLGGDNPKYGSTLGYFDASYLKIRTISLGYDFSNMGFVKNAGISRMRFYATVQNPFVFFSPYKKESGMDPETNSYGNENAAVPLPGTLKRLLTIGTNTPTTRNYLIGLELTF